MKSAAPKLFLRKLCDYGAEERDAYRTSQTTHCTWVSFPRSAAAAVWTLVPPGLGSESREKPPFLARKGRGRDLTLLPLRILRLRAPGRPAEARRGPSL